MEAETPNRASDNSHGNDLEAAVLARYGNAAQEVEACLCLPLGYDQALLAAIPQEIIDKDYGCGDPARYLRARRTALDLGFRHGKARFIFAPIVGAKGKMVGV